MNLTKVLNTLIFQLHVGNGVEQEVFQEILNLVNLVYGEKGVDIVMTKIRCTQRKYYFRDSIEARDCEVAISQCLVEK